MSCKPSRIALHVSIAVLLLAMIETGPVARRAAATDGKTTKADNRLIVHEWGTFTSIAGKDGVAVDWRPLNGSSDLPGFVYDTSGLATGTGLRSGQRCIKCNMEALVRMETPVIYFYADRETTVSVRVEFSQGKITEWYPQARLVYVPAPDDARNPSSIDWGRITVMPGAEETFPVEAQPSHYYPARETDAAPLRICTSKGDQQEKFLFYRGVGTFSPPVEVKLDAGRVVVKNTSRESIAQCILFENRVGKVGYQVLDSFDGEVVLDRSALNQPVDSLERDLEAILVSRGLYEKEARAMIKTWRDSWFEEGMRVFYIVPRKVTDSILPITIEPRPSELTRILVGRVEIITPEMENEIRHQATGLEGSAIDVQGAAAEITRKHGRFAEPVLKTLLGETNDPGLRGRIQQLIDYAATGLR
ncbi:MAG TPA: hypothetical protein VK651_04815 [Blastocatellia bacterium]|nr:hypothetical protein [Blastocatellia bacterium]